MNSTASSASGSTRGPRKPPKGLEPLPIVQAAELEAFAARVLTAAGLTEAGARVIAACLLEANLRGVDTHGVMRLLQYSECLAAGEVEARPVVRVVRREAGRALVDAGGGYGFEPTLLAADLAIELGREHGLAVVGVRNSHHFGMAASYALRIARAGLIAIVAANTQPVMPPPGGARAAAGNNPMAFAIPRRGKAPLVFDMALSQTAFGRIRLAAVEGRPIPEGWAFDAHGRPTTDAAVALEAQLLAPMGAHKGYGLSLVVDVLAAVLTGSAVGSAADAHAHRTGGVGHFVLALRSDLFVPEDAFHEALERRFAEILATPPAAGSDRVRLPGDPELETESRRREEGVPLSETLAEQLSQLARKLGAAGPPWEQTRAHGN